MSFLKFGFVTVASELYFCTVKNHDNHLCGDSGFFGVEKISAKDDNFRLISKTLTSHIYLGNVSGVRRVFKVVAPENMDSQLYADMLHKEFDVLSTLSHPGIVAAMGMVEVIDGREALMLEWIDGETLHDFLSKNPDEKTRRSLALQLLDAVEYLHAKGVVHRDIKPTNILVTHDGNRLKLIDFGLADNSAYTRLKIAAGTPGYMSAHQSVSANTTTADDLHAVAVVLNQLLIDKASKRITHQCRKGKYNNVIDLRDALTTAWERPKKIRHLLRQIVIVVVACIAVAALCIYFFSEQMARQRDSMMADINAQRGVTARVRQHADSVHRQDSVALSNIKKEQQDRQRAQEQHAQLVAHVIKVGEAAIDKIWSSIPDNDTGYEADKQSNDFINGYINQQQGSISDAELSALDIKLKARWRKHHDEWTNRRNNK